ncbi:Enoyl-CoA hydratase/carnithine racemase [Cohaesibacter sp. ES.047]|uniref:crotonase/enoyl-CoA hydratase family protein n=1 Tax=Cohaesibacter sp. ES.047 TaxID=1798205 RepID=UPI000BB95B23|nr:crotonase/enoyl-CoA hydratase family protein [Cohaesibacter sp. ES.047]SNY92568.1 Enoyl-CoA hydratase/carnithine racemase [Cohaesibacter sp. ES.047]
MSACDHVKVSINDGVRVIRMDRPEKKNALTIPMYDAIAEALTKANEDPDTRASVLLGVPGAFSAGNDIGEFANMAREGGLGESIIAFLDTLAEAEKPIVAGVDGLAIGVGVTMLFHCDYVVASDRALFKTPFTDLALVPEAASSLLAPRIMGHPKAFELLCIGEAFDAQSFEKAGVINKVTHSDELEPVTMQAASRIAAKPIGAMRMARDLMRKASVEDVKQRIRDEAQSFAQQLQSAEAQAAFAAFFNRK